MNAYTEYVRESKGEKGFLPFKSGLKRPGSKKAALVDKGANTDIAKLKQALADNIITQEEYEKKLAAIINKI